MIYTILACNEILIGYFNIILEKILDYVNEIIPISTIQIRKYRQKGNKYEENITYINKKQVIICIQQLLEIIASITI